MRPLKLLKTNGENGEVVCSKSFLDSVTRCQNKNQPNYSKKFAQKESTLAFTFSKKPASCQLFGLRAFVIKFASFLIKMPGTDISHTAILKSQMPLKVRCPLPSIGWEPYQLGVQLRAKKYSKVMISNLAATGGFKCK